MPGLGPIDSSRLLAGLDELYALGPMSAFSGRALAVARGLVSCEVASFNEFDLRLGRSRPFTDRDRAVLEALRPRLANAYGNALAYEAALDGRTMASDVDLSRLRLSRLTDRQRELLGLVAAGHSNAQAALMLGLSIGTVKKHLEHIFDRLGVDSRLAAARVYLEGADAGADWWSVDGVVSTLTSSSA